MSYVEYTNGEIMGRYSVYTKTGTLYKERYIYKDVIFHDINNPIVYINKYDEYLIRIVTEDNKIVASNIYEISKYENDDNTYYIFQKHIGYSYAEINEHCKDSFLFCFFYNKENRKLIVSINENKTNTFQKIII